MSVVQNHGKGMADGRQGDRIANYSKFWNKDISKEDSTGTENRVDSYTDVVNGTPASQMSRSRTDFSLSLVGIVQVTTTAPPSSTSMVGQTPSISAASTRAKPLRPLWRVTNIILPRKWVCGLVCVSSTLVAEWADLRVR